MVRFGKFVNIANENSINSASQADGSLDKAFEPQWFVRSLAKMSLIVKANKTIHTSCHISSFDSWTSCLLQICKSASLRVCGSVDLRVCASASLPVCQSAGLSVCKSASLPVCKSARLPVCRSANLQICKSTSLQIPHRNVLLLTQWHTISLKKCRTDDKRRWEASNH